jgi:hypothetical protein
MLVTSDIAVNWAVSEVIVAVGVLLVETVVVSAIAGVTDLCTGTAVVDVPKFPVLSCAAVVFTAVDVHEIHDVKIS